MAKAVKHWLATSGVETLYIEPSKASSVGERLLKETFISRMRDELFNREMFANQKKAK
jgi:hypothetical protein